MNKTDASDKQLEEAHEWLSERFYNHLIAKGYPSDCISKYRITRLTGKWDHVFELSDCQTGQLLAVIKLHMIGGSLSSYGLNLCYSEEHQCGRTQLSQSPDAGIQGFLFSRAGDGLAFFKVKYRKRKGHPSCSVDRINDFPSYEELKRSYRRRKFIQNMTRPFASLGKFLGSIAA